MRRALALGGLAVVAGVLLVGTTSAAPPAPKQGDITAVLAGTGIKVSSTPNPPGDGSTGDVTVSLADCPSGQVRKSGGPGTWTCAADDTLAGSAAGGDLTGTYPNPTIGAEKVTAAKTDLLDRASVQAEETTSASTCSDLATPGPSVTVDAPEGLISVFAQVEGKIFAEGIYQGGWQVCIQIGANPPEVLMRRDPCGSGLCSQPVVPAFETWNTVPGRAGFPAVAGARGSWVVFPVSGTGPQTVTLKYACLGTFGATDPIPCDASHTASFRNRSLWVMGLG
jgi:hypothetical protein